MTVHRDETKRLVFFFFTNIVLLYNDMMEHLEFYALELFVAENRIFRFVQMKNNVFRKLKC